jgi:hypothetical protein
MGYYANFEGTITFKKIPSIRILDEIRDIFEKDFYRGDYYFKDAGATIEFYGYEKFYEDPFKTMLFKASNLLEVAEGSVEFTGEDGEHWRYIYDDGKWYEQAGRVVYDGRMFPL